MLLAITAAFAAELSPTHVFPSAVAMEAGSGQAGVGAVVAIGPQGAGYLRAAAGITDRLAISGGLMEPQGGLLVGLRYNVVQTDTIRVAPFVFGAVNDDLVVRPGNTPLLAFGAGAGVALEGGWPGARLDLSVPLVLTGMELLPSPLYGPLVLGSAGVTAHITARHALRVGMEPLAAPSLGFRYARERWYLQGTALYSLVRAGPLLAGEVGLRF